MGALTLVGSTAELGAGRRGASLGPDALITAGLRRGLRLFEDPSGLLRTPLKLRHFRPSVEHLHEVADLAERVRDHHRQALVRGGRTLVLTGDHGNAVGFVAGLQQSLPSHARVGLVWIDAHGDLHSPLTTPSGNAHGMPLAALLGLDNAPYAKRDWSPQVGRAWARLCGVSAGGARLRPEDVMLVDVRDLEPEEWALIRHHGIPHVRAADRRRWGIDAVIQRVVHKFAAGYDAIYVSFDVDSLDARYVKGTGCPVPGGMHPAEATALLAALVSLPAFRCLEISEINPLLDEQNRVAEQVGDILHDIWPGLTGAWRLRRGRLRQEPAPTLAATA